MSSFTQHSFTYENSNVTKTLAYLDGGPQDAPLLIFMHGWPGIAKVWQPQLEYFLSKGFRVVASDMPGYGNSTHRKVYSDYSIENTVDSQLALLSHINRSEAVWIAHDWGCGTLWGLAAHHPEVVRAAAGLTVPYHVQELGIEENLKWINRTIYPEERYPYGQWSYYRFYEVDFEKAAAFFDRGIPGTLLKLFANGVPDQIYQPASTADVLRDGGWFGGRANPPSVEETPDNMTALHGDVRKELTASMEKTGFWTAGAWYMNSERNRAYTLDKWVNCGILEMPVLFIEAKYDNIVAASSSDIALPQKENTLDLTYVTIDAGHWVNLEKPDDTNAALEKFLQKKVGDYWKQAGDH